MQRAAVAELENAQKMPDNSAYFMLMVGLALGLVLGLLGAQWIMNRRAGQGRGKPAMGVGKSGRGRELSAYGNGGKRGQAAQQSTEDSGDGSPGHLFDDEDETANLL